jgi:hypothetical protein
MNLQMNVNKLARKKKKKNNRRQAGRWRGAYPQAGGGAASCR